MTICKEICKNYRAKKPFIGTRYGAGQKWCNDCRMFMNCKGIFCPCCNQRLRMNPRTREQKQKIVKMLQGKNIKNNVLKTIISAASLSAITGICVNHGIQHLLHSTSGI